jgi:hypothetical protein
MDRRCDLWSVCFRIDFNFVGDQMRSKTHLLLSIVDAMSDYDRDALLQDLEELLARKKYYTTEELSVRYSVTIQTLKNWEKDRKLVPDLRVGAGCVRYSAAVVAEFERKHPGKGA